MSSLAVVTDDSLDDGPDEPTSSSFGSPLPPEDRIWRHPSELAGLAIAPERPTGHSWPTAAFSAVGGALAVGVLWLAVGTGEDRVATEWVSMTPIHTVTPRVVDPDDWGWVVTATARRGTMSVVSSSQNKAIAGAFAYRDDGYLLTSARAVGGQGSLIVIDANGVAHDASVIGADPRTDVSVLLVDQGTDAAVVAEGDPLEPGDRLAIVDPGGSAVESTVTDTSSHVSTTNGDTVLGVVALDNGLGEVPPGSPAVDDTGAVVGMTTATDPGTEAALVPIDIAREVAGDLIDDGVATHSWLGVTARDVTDDEIAQGIPQGALITSVTSDGPAAAAGLLSGDVIVQVGSNGVDSVSGMVIALRHYEPGNTVSIRLDRDGETSSVPVVLGSVDGASG